MGFNRSRSIVRAAVALLPCVMLAMAMSPAAAGQALANLTAQDDSIEAIEARVREVERLAVQGIAVERRARELSDQARERAQAARTRAEALAAVAESRSAQDREDREAADIAAQTALMEAEQAAAEAERLLEESRRKTKEAEAAKARAEAMKAQLALEMRNRYIGITIAAAVILLIVGLAWWRLRRSRLEIATIRAANPDPVADCVLIGSDQHVQLSGRHLPKTAGGVVIGRHPEKALAVLNYNDVSRVHLRVFHEDGSFWVEDLRSSFGTKLNGLSLNPHEKRILTPGAIIEIAGYPFEFHVLEGRA